MKKRTHKASAKRLKITPSGRIFHRRAGYVHKLSKKRPQYRRQARRDVEATGADRRRLRRILNV
ncbi:50S ribosomal protein L35 [Candidatus Bipolaricaulota bacterium]|nr:50S ribosomal protein L35 [Candidatus Bipolaricaulota bacterium]